MSDNNWNLIGHQWAVDLLQAQMAGGKLRHAYLITGPQGSGRRTLATRLAQALNCQDPPEPGAYCGECRACRGFAKMAHPDLHLVELQEGDREIKVDAVRELSRGLALTPYEARYQVALLLDFEQASESAVNALLKTLEEPPGSVVLLLTAESAESLPATIASRCELLRLRPVPVDELAAGLTVQHGIPAEQAQLLASVSGGRPGYALRLQADPEALAQRAEWLDAASEMLAADRVARFAFAQEASQDRDALQGLLQVWLSFWRDVLLRVGRQDAQLANRDRDAQLTELAGVVDLAGAAATVTGIERTLGLLANTNVNARLALESLLLELPSS
jgi:DNA polymerase-3 subunit delta'